mmetsp:Transcript_11571/g.27753  ORF Transcript_11571/g.27753 Transcript_11571/m.27753 type:complete len:258 (-) Transcript_11571:620-1393(-)
MLGLGRRSDGGGGGEGGGGEGGGGEEGGGGGRADGGGAPREGRLPPQGAGEGEQGVRGGGAVPGRRGGLEPRRGAGVDRAEAAAGHPRDSSRPRVLPLRRRGPRLLRWRPPLHCPRAARAAKLACRVHGRDARRGAPHGCLGRRWGGRERGGGESAGGGAGAHGQQRAGESARAGADSGGAVAAVPPPLQRRAPWRAGQVEGDAGALHRAARRALRVHSGGGEQGAGAGVRDVQGGGDEGRAGRDPRRHPHGHRSTP